eukprot:1159208-Pelagomonas_calceolata.AAC.17
MVFLVLGSEFVSSLSTDITFLCTSAGQIDDARGRMMQETTFILVLGNAGFSCRARPPFLVLLLAAALLSLDHG